MRVQESTAAKPSPPLSNPNFRRLWIGQAISQVGDGLTSLALLITINRLTGSPAALAGITIAISLPQFLVGLVAGVFVDRWDRRVTMIASDVLRGLLVLSFMLVRRREDIWLFYVIGFLQAAIGTFFEPAKGALIPAIVDRDAMLQANALSQTTRVLSGVIGAGLAGILVGALGSWSAFGLDSLSFFVSAVFIFLIRLPVEATRPSAGVKRHVLADLADGFRYLHSRPVLIGTLSTFSVTMLGLGAVNVLFVPFLVNHLGVDTKALGLANGAQVAGMIIGGTVAGLLLRRLKISQVISIGVIGLGIFIALTGTATHYWVVLGLLFLIGLAVTPIQSAASAVIQGATASEMRGRVGSVMSTCITLSSVLSMAVAGGLATAMGIRTVFYISGGIAVAAGLLALPLMRDRSAEAVVSQA